MWIWGLLNGHAVRAIQERESRTQQRRFLPGVVMDSFTYMSRLQRKCHQKAMHRRLEPSPGPIVASGRLLKESGRLTVNFIRESFLVLGVLLVMGVGYDSLTNNNLVEIFQYIVQWVGN
jgi:hypothetical protein